ncbi:hypothetical protein ACX80W_06350 [Arthrobacter sp. TMN-37]
MAKSQPGHPGQGTERLGVKGPLVFSAVLAVVAGAATTVFATGGGSRVLRVDLGMTAAGIAFIVSLVICAMLMISAKPNPEHLGKGSGVNRSSAAAGAPGASGGAPTRSDSEDAAGEPRYGQRSSGTPEN